MTLIKPYWIHSSKIQLRLNRLKIIWLNPKIFVSTVKEEAIFSVGVYVLIHTAKYLNIPQNKEKNPNNKEWNYDE